MIANENNSSRRGDLHIDFLLEWRYYTAQTKSQPKTPGKLQALVYKRGCSHALECTCTGSKANFTGFASCIVALPLTPTSQPPNKQPFSTENTPRTKEGFMNTTGSCILAGAQKGRPGSTEQGYK
ncbi:unnamed protein product [Boreogadus saida]